MLTRREFVAGASVAVLAGGPAAAQQYATQPIKLTGAREKVAKKTYIRAPKYPQAAFDKALAECKADTLDKAADKAAEKGAEPRK
mgnify:CR=1 FL=1